MHLPEATFDWYCRNYLDRDYPLRMILRLNGVEFPEKLGEVDKKPVFCGIRGFFLRGKGLHFPVGVIYCHLSYKYEKKMIFVR